MTINNKKGQIQSKIFILILALIIGGMIILFGYNAIKEMNEKGDRAAVIRFTTKLSEDVTSLSSEPGSVKTEKYGFPSSFDRICFVDLQQIQDLTYLNSYPLIKDSVKSQAEANIFFLKDNTMETAYIEGLRLGDPYFNCVDSGKTVKVKMEGNGDGTFIETPTLREWCFNAQNSSLCDGLDVLFGTGYKCRCCDEHALCCTGC